METKELFQKAIELLKQEGAEDVVILTDEEQVEEAGCLYDLGENICTFTYKGLRWAMGDHKEWSPEEKTETKIRAVCFDKKLEEIGVESLAIVLNVSDETKSNFAKVGEAIEMLR